MLIRGGPQSGLTGMPPDKRFQRFEEFLVGFVRELNALSAEGEMVLVEGKRDMAAMLELGYHGKITSIATFRRRESRQVLDKARRVIILTDLDREGRQLAARYARFLSHEGRRFSLEYRRRLLVASRGTFLHIENLSRFRHINPDLAIRNQST